MEKAKGSDYKPPSRTGVFSSPFLRCSGSFAFLKPIRFTGSLYQAGVESKGPPRHFAAHSDTVQPGRGSLCQGVASFYFSSQNPDDWCRSFKLPDSEWLGRHERFWEWSAQEAHPIS